MDQVDAWLQTRVTNKLGVLIKPLIGRIEIHVRNIVPIKLFRIWTDETFIHRFRRTWAAISQLRRWWWNFEFRPLSLRPTPPGAPQKNLKLNEWRMNVSLNHFLDKKKCLDKDSETVGRNVTAINGSFSSSCDSAALDTLSICRRCCHSVGGGRNLQTKLLEQERGEANREKKCNATFLWPNVLILQRHYHHTFLLL